jgi:hypothetical protein
MTSYSTLRWLVAIVLTMALSIHEAAACSCAVRNICDLVEGADVIFLGEVVEGGLDPGEDAWSGRPTFARMRIIEAYKGLRPDTREVTVELFYLKGMCSPAVYRRGERTLVFLAKPENNGALRDGACSGSRFEKSDPSGLQYVRDYFGGRTSTTIRGQVAANTYPGAPIEGAQVTAQGIGRRFVVNADERGEYAISGIPEGQYRVSAEKAGYSKANPDDPSATSFDVEVRARGCAIQDLRLWANNSLKGLVSDASGKPVAGIWVSLQEVSNTEDHGEEEPTDERGEFEFQHIDPGRHYLAVNPFGASARSPYDTRYYGGATTREQGQAVRIEPTSRLSSMNIELGQRIPTRQVRILLEFPDGTPVSESFFLCGDARNHDNNSRYFVSAEPSTAGTRVCKILIDRPYRIRTTRIGNNFEPKDTPDVVIPTGDQDAEVKIQVGPQDAVTARE